MKNSHHHHSSNCYNQQCSPKPSIQSPAPLLHSHHHHLLQAPSASEPPSTAPNATGILSTSLPPSRLPPRPHRHHQALLLLRWRVRAGDCPCSRERGGDVARLSLSVGEGGDDGEMERNGVWTGKGRVVRVDSIACVHSRVFYPIALVPKGFFPIFPVIPVAVFSNSTTKPAKSPAKHKERVLALCVA